MPNRDRKICLKTYRQKNLSTHMLRLRNNRNRTKKEEGEFFDLQQKFNEINNVVTEQQKQNDLIDLADYVLDENNPFNDLKTGNIYIKDDLFDNNDSKDIKKVSDDVIETINLTDGVPFVDLGTYALKK